MKSSLAALIALIGTVAFAEPPAAATVPESGAAIRVDGDREAVAAWNANKGEWRSGASDIDTALPVGYPPPTPPGSIDIKTYPAVRRAEIADRGNSGFMPLFRHIQRNKIAMTSPVEMDYETSGTTTLRTSSMSFLYRTPDLHETGTDPKDTRITIRDADPITVVSMGGRGSYDRSRVENDVEKLRAWLGENPKWEEAGEPRALLYNGPTFTPWNKWLEVQIPVRLRAKAAKTANDPPKG